MASVEQHMKPGAFDSGVHNLLEGMKLLKEMQDHSGVRKAINSELWHACAGPLVTLPQVGSLVYYFPQGHSEQVAVSTNRMATTQIPSYPNLPSHLLCQVQSVALHADKDTDEVYAQMSLQPVNSERDVFPVPDFRLKHSRHPTEFFCKTLTASDTSTHGGFSVPRRAAEKLFPQLDYSMQPPTQELVVRDIHDNTWNFRHIYRGQPKRHLLTTGWSMFIGAKRLRAGDAVLFVRDEKSQLLVGVRRVNRQQAALPSSVLSADSMHIGILAAAAHAATNRSPFTIFYNPRACPSEFIIPLAKYRKAMYGANLSMGMRFGKMFETEDFNKRRFMGTIVGSSDLDPLRWPNSKWRSLQVEWDEPGSGDKQTRVSPWEIETPESLFIIPSLTGNLKRPFHSAFLGAQPEWETSINRILIDVKDSIRADIQCPSVSSIWPEQFTNKLMKSQTVMPLECQPQMQSETKMIPEIIAPVVEIDPQCVVNQPNIASANNLLPIKPATLTKFTYPAPVGAGTGCELSKLEPALALDQLSQFQSVGQCYENEQDIAIMNQIGGMQVRPWITQSRLDPHFLQTPEIDSFQGQSFSAKALLQYPCQFEFSAYTSLCPSPVFHKSIQPSPSPETVNQVLPALCQELWDSQFNIAMCISPSNLSVLLPQHEILNLQHNSCLKDLPEESHNQSDISSCLNLADSNNGSTVVDPSVSSTILDDFSTLKKAEFHDQSDYLVANLCSNQDVQSQITLASLADSQTFPLQEFADSYGGASTSNLDFDDDCLLQHGSWKQLTQRFRTYTKIQKAGSVGRSIDVSRFKTYDEMRSEIEHMFGLESMLNDMASGWKLVYVDFENDVLLVGDDPWEEFVGCVKCIRILSPSEVQQMGEEGMQLLNSTGLHTADGSVAEVGYARNGSN